MKTVYIFKIVSKTRVLSSDNRSVFFIYGPNKSMPAGRLYIESKRTEIVNILPK